MVPGAEHGRGETGTASPGGSGVTPEPSGAGERGREAHTIHPYVFVLDKHGTPLQPCPPARARTLLAKGRAVVHRHTPFTIRLKDRTAADSQIDGVEIGIDPGSKHTGIAVFTEEAGERRGRYSIQLDHRGAQIRKKMGQRSGYRRRRRSVNLRHRPPRFANRTRPQGWLSPSLRHRPDTTVSWVDRLSRLAPVRSVHVERVAFDTHALAAGRSLEGAEYQQGTLHGFEVREYLLAKFGRTCVYCGATNTPLNLDHVHPRSKGGSDRVSNLVLACVPCNQAKANRTVEEFVRNPRALARILARAKTPLKDAAAVQSTRWALWRALDSRLPTHVGTGGRTKWNRTRNRLPKSHTLDALAVGKLDTITAVVDRILVAGCAGRGSYARTRPDRHGFPRLRLPRTKRFFGFATGDLVRAVVPTGKKAGTHTGRVAVRASGSFNITTAHGTVQGIRHKHVRLLQRADGYAYTIRKEEGVSSRP
ncbi:RNA-guided endonuclease IscB [Nocardiopsis sp. EMB25]|uniref:RNA-guided endonuclease IscB n=1 Tax=Nocardiopsis sp. EMB25 TaxID=2835867 RepID=UPI0022838BAA|nr:RNA-guided endonuclease IscB [Nocardiopsis sp. EMB25]MCY9783953.1 RNA-guided endonuclease IscB [Nocardiopsis sp. EMB25]